MDYELDERVALAVAKADFDGAPITYLTGPMADRRVAAAFREHGVLAPKDRLCASINRLSACGAIERTPTGEKLAGAKNCGVKLYPVVRLA